MDKYIDVDALIRMLCLDDVCKGIDDFIDTNHSELIDMIKAMPAADVEPVKRGKWSDGICPRCSVCGEVSDYHCDGTHKRSKYCPNCGAKMKGETE